MSDFAFSDLGRVHWLATLKLTAARGLAAGIVWTIFLSTGSTAGGVGSLLTLPLMWALIALQLALFLQFVGMIFGTFSEGLGFFASFIGSLMICVGDPLVYLVNRSIPKLLNITDLSFFNFRPMIFIMYPD